ncbi:cleavage/polyadenylation factor CFT1 SCDLUD_004627 [Saccharomycodes ludwigii]|uniref:cleavage/polyadenylation factor CFT1 n=1 Tax=Saccharomycodes ludwigii TaxID=36035 RepID=UPI001E87BCB7|nr:hypothetical protein SCDLUD_004627 [Saccharomycodes ludwigii]KAH3899197.1 hypothetical protein SCDLUD_004627 [Saccharomycodes ludwigii]
MNSINYILEPSVVNHSIYGHFTSLDYKELCTVQTNVLKFYKINHSESDAKSPILTFTNEFPLVTPKITQICKILTDRNMENSSNSKLDKIILVTNDKISIVEYDIYEQTLITKSLHYYVEKFATNSIDINTSRLRFNSSNQSLILFKSDCLAKLDIFSDVVEIKVNSADENNEVEEDEIMYDDDIGNSRSLKRRKFAPRSLFFKTTSILPDLQNIVDLQFSKLKSLIYILYVPKYFSWAGAPKQNTMKFICLSTNDSNSSSGNNNTEDGVNNGKVSSLLSSMNATLTSPSSTTVIGELTSLPNDIHTIIPYKKGSFLLGVNHILYIDENFTLQVCIRFNEYSEKNLKSCKRYIDYSYLKLELQYPTAWCWLNDTVLVFNSFSFILKFEGRLLINATVQKLIKNENIYKENILSITKCEDYLFFSYQNGSCSMIEITSRQQQQQQQQQREEEASSNGGNNGDNDATIKNTAVDDDEDYGDLLSEDEDEYEKANNMLFDEEEDLYGNNRDNTTSFIINFYDNILPNLGPISSLTFGKTTSLQRKLKGLVNPNKNEQSILAVGGSNGSIIEIQPSVQPIVEKAFKFTDVTRIWNVKDKYLITTDSNKIKSDIFLIEKNYAPFRAVDFKKYSITLDMACIESRIVQLTNKGIFIFDDNFKRLFTLFFEAEVVHVSVEDLYILTTNVKGEIEIYEFENDKLNTIQLPEQLNELILTTGEILKTNMCNEFIAAESEEDQLLFTFVTADNQIIFFSKNHNGKIYQLCGVDTLSSKLFISTYQFPEEIVPDPFIKQVMVNKLGNNNIYNNDVYLTILTFGGEIYQYRKDLKTPSKFYKCTQSSLTGGPANVYPEGMNGIERVLYYIPNYTGYSVIFVSGLRPYIIIKEHNASPKIYQFANIPLMSLTSWKSNTIMCVDDVRCARILKLDLLGVYYGYKLPVKVNTFASHHNFNNITYFDSLGKIIVSYFTEVDYIPKNAIGETLITAPGKNLLSKTYTGGLLVVDPISMNILDTKDCDHMITSLETMYIKISSSFTTKEYIVVLQSFLRDEDIMGLGYLQVYDFVDNKLQLLYSDEEVRGVINSSCEVDGRILLNQSSKMFVRNVSKNLITKKMLMEPVAFLDSQSTVVDAKSFGNYVLLSDVQNGIQLYAFESEPYRFIPLGRSYIKNLNPITCDILPNTGDFFTICSTKDGNLHCFKYGPDDPSSFSGTKLVYLSKFSIGTTTTCMRTIPKGNTFGDEQEYMTLCGCTDGSIYNVVPLQESSYRRLYVIQQQIIDKMVQFGGLNHKFERFYSNQVNDKRPFIDLDLIKRNFTNQSIDSRDKISIRLGRSASVEVWRDILEVEFSTRIMN